MESTLNSRKITLFQFGLVSALWLGIGQVLCHILGRDPQESLLAARWMLGLWALSVADLFAMAQLLFYIFKIVRGDPHHKMANAIQCACWALFKMICLGLFILVLLKGQKTPMIGIVLGTGTLSVVPLMGGFLWSQRVIRHAQ